MEKGAYAKRRAAARSNASRKSKGEQRQAGTEREHQDHEKRARSQEAITIL